MNQPAGRGGRGRGQDASRRKFVEWSGAAAACGLVAGYGVFGAMAVRFLYPARDRAKTWMFATDLVRMKAGDSVTLRDPTGARIVVARRAEAGTADDFVALSSTCPHLGCQVQYQAHKKRFFCPCHNGMFDLEGKATAGPPAAARQSLAHYPLRVEKGLLFIEVPVEGLKSPREG